MSPLWGFRFYVHRFPGTYAARLYSVAAARLEERSTSSEALLGKPAVAPERVSAAFALLQPARFAARTLRQGERTCRRRRRMLQIADFCLLPAFRRGSLA